jgi:hypothetical protein
MPCLVEAFKSPEPNVSKGTRSVLKGRGWQQRHTPYPTDGKGQRRRDLAGAPLHSAGREMS